MKKIVILLLVSFPIVAISQNVGIGTTVPETKLNIVGTGSNPAIPGGASGALLRLGISSNQEGIDLGKMSVSPFSAWVQSGFNGTTPDPLTLQPLGGNVGIGTVSPAEKLDVNGNSLFTGTMNINGNMRLQGLNLFEFGAGVAGKEINAGKVGYNAFGQSALTFVGAGTNATNRAVYFFAEGGTTMNGPLNIEGPFKVNNNSGIAGQVLTSNGSGDPTWTNAAYGNNIRFAASLSAATINVTPAYSTIYNQSPADVTIGVSNITITHPGLYHIEGYISHTAGYNTTEPASIAIDVTLNIGGSSFDIISRQVPNRNYNLAGFAYEYTTRFEQDFYISGTGIVSVSSTVYVSGSPVLSFGSINGKITGYLISD